MCNIPGIGYDKLHLVRGLYSPHVWRRVASEQDTWSLMEDVFQTIDHVTRSKERNRAFFKPNFEIVQPVIQVNKVNYGKATRHNTFNWSNNGKPNSVQFSNNFRDTHKHPLGSIKKGLGQLNCKHSPKKHMAKEYIKLLKERSREQKDTDMARCYKKKIWDVVQRGNITINEMSMARALETTYSMEQMEQLLGNMQLDNSN